MEKEYQTPSIELTYYDIELTMNDVSNGLGEWKDDNLDEGGWI